MLSSPHSSGDNTLHSNQSINQLGWEGVGDERRCIAAFLFTWREGKVKAARPTKLPKVGGADYAVDDRPDIAVKVRR